MYVDQNDEAEKPDKNNYIPLKYLVRLRKTCEILLPINILLFFLCRIYILLNTVDENDKEVYKQYDTKICNKNMYQNENFVVLPNASTQSLHFR